MSGSTEVGIAAYTEANVSGIYRVNVPAGSYKLRVPSSQFQAGQSLVNFVATLSNSGAGLDDNKNQNGLSTSNPASTGVSSTIATYSLGTQPTDTNSANQETGIDITSDNTEDTNVNLTIDFGFVPEFASLGNLVFRDINSNNRFDVGIDMPMEGVTVQLFTQGATPGVTSPIDTAVTFANGTYRLKAYGAGSYFIHVPFTNFVSAYGGVLVGLNASSVSGSPATAFDDNIDQNAVVATTPSVSDIGTGVFSIPATFGSLPLDSTCSTGETGYLNTVDNAADSWGPSRCRC